LLSADSQQCVLQIHGQTQTYTMGNQISVNFAPSANALVRIEQDQHGMYRSSGMINGQRVNFLIDTGASVIALSSNLAKELGITYDEKVMQVQTASGNAKAHAVILQRLSLGNIQIYNVPAIVVEGNAPQDVLLGRSFLIRVNMKDEDHILELRQKY
jgi:aspartyl protease family protein